MNWYYNKEGISAGPHTEAELEAMVKAKEIAPECLIWHTGLEDWQPVSQLRALWIDLPKPIEPPQPVAPEIKPAPTAAAAPKAAPTTAKPDAAKPHDKPSAKPEAPATPAPSAPAPVAKPGFFRRLFGFGKK